MITLDATFSGSQLGRALAFDPEELAYALEALADASGPELAQEIADELPHGCAQEVAKMLREWAAAIEGENE